MVGSKVYIVNGRDDEGAWDLEVFKNKEDALASLKQYAADIGEWYKTDRFKVCWEGEDAIRYDAGCHWGEAWVTEEVIK